MDAARMTLLFKVINLVAFIINCGLTYGSIAGIFGETNTDLSLKYQTLVTPAGWAFSIWGPIFIWEGIFALAQFLPKFKSSQIVPAIHLWWVGVCATQIAWSIAFAQEVIWLSLVCMLAILVCLAVIVIRLTSVPATYLEFWLLKGPFFLQLGWICAASLVNVNVVIDARIPTLLSNSTAKSTLLKNGTIVGAPAILNPAYFTDSNATVLLSAAVVSLAALFLTGVMVGTYPKRVNGNAIVCGVAAWALGAVASQLQDPVAKTSLLFSPVITNALSATAAILSILMVLLVAALVAKLVYDEFLRDKNFLPAGGKGLRASLSGDAHAQTPHEKLEQGTLAVEAGPITQ